MSWQPPMLPNGTRQQRNECSYGKEEALFVRKGENVLHVCEADDDWEKYIKVSDGNSAVPVV